MRLKAPEDLPIDQKRQNPCPRLSPWLTCKTALLLKPMVCAKGKMAEFSYPQGAAYHPTLR